MTNQANRSVPVRIEQLGLAFGDTQVLREINLEIAPGEFFSFLGPSGSGKSTLLRAIAGFGPQPTGRILIGERDVAGLPPWKRDVGMVFQSYALWPHMTVRRNVAFGLEERRLPKAEIHRRVEEALELVGLLELAERRPAQLSGGQQQRVALARTIVIEPQVLLLDEPLSNLDANLRIQMRREIRELQQRLQLTTIFVTHDQEEANTTSDRMALLNDGVIQQIGSPMELYDRPANLFTARFLGTANVLEGVIAEQDGEGFFLAESGVKIPLDSGERGECCIVFRPQNVTIASTDAPVSGGLDPQLRGEVRRLEFLGNIIRYAVTVGRDTVLVDDPHQGGHTAFPVGTEVTLRLQRDQILTMER